MKPMQRVAGWIILLGMTGVGAGAGSAAELSLNIAEKAPPKEISQQIQSEVQSKAIQLLDGDQPVWEFWLRKQVPLPSKPESVNKGLRVMKETGLLGVAAVHRSQRDYRDDEVFEGVYTMRLGLKPQDGNHLGTSIYPFFALLVPAERDTEVAGFTAHDPLVEASMEDTPTGHPVILSLYPVYSVEGDLPKLHEPEEDHKSVQVSIPAKVTGSDEETELVFDLVYKGTGEI